jgi:hypothetical protein
MAARKTRTRVLIVTALCCASPSRSDAQQSVRDVLDFLVTQNQSVPTGAPEKDREAAQATSQTISRALLVALATVPISSSTGGFTYVFNSQLGTVERTSETFGPFFTERATGAGRNQASFGVTYQYARFSTLDGNELRAGTFVTTANKFRGEAAPFDVDVLTLNIETNTVTVFGNYGVTDHFDVAAAVPLVALRMDGQRINTYYGQSFLKARGSATTAGLADVAVRAKYSLIAQRGSGLAVGTEVRLPTGREEDLLGAGAAALKVLALASVERGRIGTHLNGGYTVGGISKELSYSGALTFASTPHVTLTGELIGRRIDDLKGITQAVFPHPLYVGVDTIRLLPGTAGANIAMAVGGVKWNTGGKWLLNTNVLIPLTDAGLSARIVPTVALDYSF